MLSNQGLGANLFGKKLKCNVLIPQKQSPECSIKKVVLKNFVNIQSETSVLESLFNIGSETLLKRQVFSCVYCEIFENTYFHEQLQTDASVSCQ